ncbi:hypothetical protein BJX64DRAFT_250164 [Aspergillus heterothallicus]
MPPLTKFWLCALKDPSQQPSTLIPLLTEILELCASFTNPTGPDLSTKGNSTPQTHAFYTVSNLPGHLMMITGYPSQELNNAADRAYAERFLPTLFEHVKHVWLRQIEIDVAELPVSGDGVVVGISSGKGKEEKKGKGGWDVWKKTRQGAEGGDVVQGVRQGEDEEERFWVSVQCWDGEGAGLETRETERERGSVFYLRKLVGV